MLSEMVLAQIDALAPVDVTHVSFLASNSDGELLLSTPKHHPHRITATFPRVKRLNDRVSVALSRCLQESQVLNCQSAYPLAQVWTSEHSSTFVVAGIGHSHLEAGTSHLFGWYSPTVARRQIEASPNLGTRRRDLGLLEAVERMTLSPSRRIVMMVCELHKLGFERLRLVPVGEEGGGWGCVVVPSACVSLQDELALAAPAAEKFGRVLGIALTPYRSVQGQEPWGWTDAVFDPPEALAQKFISRCSALAIAGWGCDERYAAWFESLVDATVPHGLPTNSRPPSPGLPGFVSITSCPGLSQFPRMSPKNPADGVLGTHSPGCCEASRFLLTYMRADKLLRRRLLELDPSIRYWGPTKSLEENFTAYVSLAKVLDPQPYHSLIREAHSALERAGPGGAQFPPQEAWGLLDASWQHLIALLGWE